jgi:ATP-dependent protease HslVU (ClpYQ) ATPase subunit
MLKQKNKKREFNLQLRNRFQKLGELENEEVEHHWLKVKDAFVKTAKEVLGFRNPTRKDWLSEETWKKTEDRRKIKDKLVSCQTRGRKIELQAEYETDHEVKRNARTDRRRWIRELGERAENAGKKTKYKRSLSVNQNFISTGFKESPSKKQTGDTLGKQGRAN